VSSNFWISSKQRHMFVKSFVESCSSLVLSKSEKKFRGLSFGMRHRLKEVSKVALNIQTKFYPNVGKSC
jgi:hypothetical protein